MEYIPVFYEKYSKYFSHAKNKALLAEEKQKKKNAQRENNESKNAFQWDAYQPL